MTARIRAVLAALRGRPVVYGVTFSERPGWDPASLQGGQITHCIFR